MRIAGDPSMLTIVAPVRLISGQKLLTEKRRSIAARPPTSSVPTTHTEIALKWNSGSGVSTTSSGPRCHARDLVGEAHDVVVREHAALRRTGRARGVDEAREIARAHRDVGDGGVAPRGERVLPGDRGPGVDDRVGRVDRDAVRQRGRGLVADDLDRARREVALDDEHLGARVGELVAQELALVRGVDRHLHRAELQRREEADDLLGPVLEQRRDPVAVHDAQLTQGVGEAVRSRGPSRGP